MEKVTVRFGGSFDPFANHHAEMIRAALQRYNHVTVAPCGVRPDKRTVNDIDPVHRATMIQYALRGIERVDIDLHDLERDVFTPNIEVEHQARECGEKVVHVVGADLLNGDRGIRETWKGGEELWDRAEFLVFSRQGTNLDSAGLPRNSKVVTECYPASSSLIRERIYRGQKYADLVHPDVVRYIETFELYRGRVPKSKYEYNLGSAPPPVYVYVDEWKEETRQIRNMRFRPVKYPADAKVIVVLGGDGTLLRAVRELWHLRIPFLPVNFGTVGFLMNDCRDMLGENCLWEDLSVRWCPLMSVRVKTIDAEEREALAFNDVLVTAGQADSAWMELFVDDRPVTKMYGDGALVCTAAGSPGWYRSMGQRPFAPGTTDFGITGRDLYWPPFWSAPRVPYDSEVEIRTADLTPRPKRYPIYCYADGKNGVAFGEIESVRVRKSRVAAAMILYKAQYDLGRKMQDLWRPPTV